MSKINQVYKSIPQKRILLHFLFWGVAFYVLLKLFAVSSSFQRIDFIYTSVFLTTIITPCYLSLYLIIPRFLEKRSFLFVCFSIINILLFVFINQLLFNKLIDYILPGYYFISYYSFIDLLKFHVAFIALTALIKLSKDWFSLNEKNKRFTKIEKEKLEAELKALMNQVNPHFLFNSLTVLYSLAIENSNKTPDAIIKLSDILRYVIYESNHNLVAIKLEVKLLEDYIHLQRFRIPEESNIELITNIKDTEIKIAPMLLLPLLENSFKHGIKGDIKKTFIKINMNVINNNFIFSISNNKGNTAELENFKNSGVGLSNIKKRLELIYPIKHTFEINESKDFFTVTLTLKL